MGFDAEWLTLREGADARARDPALLDRAVQIVAPHATVLDLGCGTGASVRALAKGGAPHLDWRLLDNDPALLEIAADYHPRAATYHADLGDIDALPLDGVRLVTASALLDLVSRDWVARFAERLWRARVAFYAVLSYDGRMRWQPADPDDGRVTDAFNRHQQGDKGFGPALGPHAADTAAEMFRKQGFDVTLGNSPWRLTPEDAALQDALLTGIAGAATEAGCETASDWLARRRHDLEQTHAEIGHVDLLARPPA